ncbi:hypothetical protein AB0J80_22515 [Actinoplanes sp. NPDC049548]|uniref:hypothetical protein n=1 Tax=Actinoplanes sp. NPDC049548 TaxID=3155152 RepID=UPI003441F444
MPRAGEVAGLGLGDVDVAVVPRRRVWELARYGLEAKAPTLRRHPYQRKLAGRFTAASRQVSEQ